MKKFFPYVFVIALLAPLMATAQRANETASPALNSRANIGVGAKPIRGAEVLLDGARKTLDEKWTYWEGPRFGSSLPIKWKIVDDPVDKGTVVLTDDPAAAGRR